jgi:hypothetical protein
VSTHPFDLLIDALGTEGACFVLGAGASAPHVPTMAQLPARLNAFVGQLRSFPAGRVLNSPLTQLIAPLIERATQATTLEEWKAGAMTPATIAVGIAHLIAAAHWRRLPQYDVFSLLPQTSSIVSFNWDGLARARCRQRPIVHPHGALRPRVLEGITLDELFRDSQMVESSESRYWFLPGLVMPGEEDASHHAPLRDQVFSLWRRAPCTVVIGYRFGLGSSQDYDRVWLDTFVEAFKVNSNSPLHVIAPNAEEIRSALAERTKRTITIHAWPLNWYALSRVLLAAARLHNLTRIRDLRKHQATLDRAYAAVAERSSAIA